MKQFKDRGSKKFCNEKMSKDKELVLRQLLGLVMANRSSDDIAPLIILITIFVKISPIITSVKVMRHFYLIMNTERGGQLKNRVDEMINIIFKIPNICNIPDEICSE